MIPSKHTFANHLLLGFVVQGKITEADIPTVWLGATPSKLVSDLHHPPFVHRMNFLPQPSRFILVWDRHRNMLGCIRLSLNKSYSQYIKAVVLLQFREELYIPTEIAVGRLYAAISSYSSQWSRASVIKKLPEQKVSC